LVAAGFSLRKKMTKSIAQSEKARGKKMNKYLKPETLLGFQSSIVNRQSSIDAAFRGSRGTTLIEVLMASVIFMIGMLALLGMQTTAMHSNKIGNEISEATILVSDEIERLWGQDFSSADLSAGAHNDPNNPVDVQGEAGGKYNRQWTVIDDRSNSNSWLITVRVTWTDSWVKARQVEFTYAR
jgi:hypothetical protein